MNFFNINNRFPFDVFKPYISSILKVVTIVLLCSLESISQQTNPGIFYAVTKQNVKDTSYLFGTYHLVKDSYLSELSFVKKALTNSKGIVVETILDPADMQRVQVMGMMQNKLITDFLTKPLADSLNAELTSTLGVDLTVFNQLKPINVVLTLSVVHLMNNNAVLQQFKGQALDAYFAEFGKTNAKNVTSLETIDEQMDIIFNQMSEQEQADQLIYFLRNKAFMIEMGDELLKSWFANDLDKIYAVFEKLSDASGQSDFLLKTRNDKWMKVLPKLIQKESQFVAVGALHLGGPDGLIAQLQQQGYKVTPIKL
jgi:uncharacterized protein